MARPQKIGINYYPTDVDIVRDIKIQKLLRYHNGPAALGVLIALFSQIYSQRYYLEWEDDQRFVLARDLYAEENFIQEIINACLDFGIFDKNLYDDHRILTSHGIQQRYFMAAKRRKSDICTLPYVYSDIKEEFGKQTKEKLLHTETELLRTETELPHTKTELLHTETELSYTKSTQRKEKKSKLNNSSTTRARERDDGSLAGEVDNSFLPEISIFIQQLLSDTDALWRIVRETGYSINDVKLWIFQLGRKWELRKPHEDYGDFLCHIINTLKIKSKKKERPNEIYVENLSTAKALWRVVQADLILNDSLHAQIFESLEVYDFKENEKKEKELILIAPNGEIRDTVKNELIGKIKENMRKFTSSLFDIKCGTESKEKKE